MSTTTKYLIYHENKYHEQSLVGSLEACSHGGAMSKVEQRYGTTEGYDIIETTKYDRTPTTVEAKPLRVVEMRYC